jgi:hypothetical protein
MSRVVAASSTSEPSSEQTNHHQVQFNNYLVEFIQKMKVILPSESRIFAKYYKYYRGYVDQGKRVEFIGEFVQYISKYKKELSLCDEGLFSEEDDYYPKKPIQLMKGIDFKKIWRNDDLTEGSKENIWKYLQTLYLIGSFVLKEHDEYAELMKQQNEIINNLFESMVYEKKIKADAERMNQADIEANKSSGFDLSQLSELFDGDNVITQIALEIAKEVNLSGDLGGMGDPFQLIQTLFSKDSTKLQEIIAKVSQRLSSVLEEKDLTEEELVNQAKQMNDKILGKLKGIPGMPNIEELSQKLASQLSSKDQSGGPAPEGSVPVHNIQELTEHFKQNLSQLGLDNMDNVQKMFSQIINPDGPNGPNGPNGHEKTDEIKIHKEPVKKEKLKKKFGKNRN